MLFKKLATLLLVVIGLSLKGQLYTDYARVNATNPPGLNNVGIGIDNPLEKLHVNGNGKFNGTLKGPLSNDGVMIGSLMNNYIQLYTDNNDKAWFLTDKPYLVFQSDFILDGTKFNIDCSGDLTIGSDIATMTFHHNDIYTSFSRSVHLEYGQWLGFYIPSAGHGQPNEDDARLVFHHNGTHGYIDYQDNLHFRANKNWISALTCYGDGTVGIGFETTYNQGHYKVPEGYKLAVNGAIICEEVKVIDDVPDADFVFEKGYELMELPELENFINENKHLPDIPSALEFKQQGYKIGDMDEMLLRKIEELTLYVIELKKENEAIKESLKCKNHQ